MSSVPQRKFTLQEYLDREERSETRHEFYLGEIFAMSGGSLAHGVIGDNVSFRLRESLTGRGCRTHGSSQRIQIPGVELHTYPDVSVVCGEPKMSEIDPYAITNPIAIVEVLSTSTEMYDRGKKFAFYRRIPTLREYLLVDQFEPRVEIFSQSAEGLWKIDLFEGMNAKVLIPALGCTLAMNDIYQDVVFLPRPTEVER